MLVGNIVFSQAFSRYVFLAQLTRASRKRCMRFIMFYNKLAQQESKKKKHSGDTYGRSDVYFKIETKYKFTTQ